MTILGEVFLDGKKKELTKEQIVQLRSAVCYNPQDHLFNATVRKHYIIG